MARAQSIYRSSGRSEVALIHMGPGHVVHAMAACEVRGNVVLIRMGPGHVVHAMAACEVRGNVVLAM